MAAPTIVPGVTVTGKREACGKRDQACIDSVSREIWTKYPKQIATLCAAEKMRLIRQSFQAADIGIPNPEFFSTRLNPETSALCDYGARMKKR